MNIKQKTVMCIVVLLAFQLVLIPPAQATGYSDYLDSIIDLAQERYYQDISEDELVRGALKGIFGTMDDYTVFFDIDEANSFLTTMEGNYQGIGVEIIEVPEGVLVTRVFENSPAEGAGVLANDMIVRVDGVDIGGFRSTDVASLIRGEIGTTVELGISRNALEDILTIRVERGVVSISPVTWRVDGDMMYIRLESFSSNCVEYFKQALKEMDDRGLHKMILDLRNNPGGEVLQAVGIARLLIRQGLITKLDFKSEDMKDIEYYSHNKEVKYLPAVLVNGNSASASEILASAIQDSQDGFLIGTKTFGKGVVQNIYPILTPSAYKKYKQQYGASVVDGYDWINKYGVTVYETDLIGWTKITTGHYLTRKGEMIDGVGITPDFAVEDYEWVEGMDIHGVNHLNSNVAIELNGIGNDVYNAEKILTIKGYKPEKPDNILDARTCEILKQYQVDSGLESTGILDEATKRCINKDLEILRLSIDGQYAKAVELLGLIN